jgi:hypothetical protein
MTERHSEILHKELYYELKSGDPKALIMAMERLIEEALARNVTLAVGSPPQALGRRGHLALSLTGPVSLLIDSVKRSIQQYRGGKPRMSNNSMHTDGNLAEFHSRRWWPC